MHIAGPAATAAAPWVVPLVVVLVVAGVALLAAALAAAPRPAPRSWRSFADDDLPDFATCPPGCGTLPPASGTTSSPAFGAKSWKRRALALAGVVALAAAAAVTVVATRGGPDAYAGAETAELTFGGVVLEQRAVGVTVTYPRVSAHVARAGATAHVRLPTYNCLTDEPPADPVAAGCLRTLVEYADLRTPELSVTHGRNGSLRLSGRFATYTRPNGTPSVVTGRVYELTVTARRREAGGAEGELVLGAGRTTTVAGRVNALRFGG